MLTQPLGTHGSFTFRGMVITHTWMSQEVSINGERINGLVISPTYEWSIPWGEKTH